MRAAVFLWACVMLAAGCVSPQKTSVDRASRELSCPPSQLTTVNRTDIDGNVFDVSGCGRVARYACVHAHQAETFCVREPNPDPAEEAARPKTPPPPPPAPRKVTDIPR
jgi:hypothetical protein